MIASAKSCAVALTLLAAAACDSRESAVVAPGASLPAVSPSENVVTVHVGQKGQYAVGEERNLNAGQLQAAVARGYARGSGPRVVRVLGAPEVTGYDVVMAVNAARAAGARRVDGVADYSEDGSTGNRKVWSEPIEPLPASTQPDTTLR